jgi:hypothetical protein
MTESRSCIRRFLNGWNYLTRLKTFKSFKTIKAPELKS